MGRKIDVGEIIQEAEEAQAAFEEASEARRNIKRAARALADAGVLTDAEVAKIEEVFPARASKEETAAE